MSVCSASSSLFGQDLPSYIDLVRPWPSPKKVYALVANVEGHPILEGVKSAIFKSGCGYLDEELNV